MAYIPRELATREEAPMNKSSVENLTEKSSIAAQITT